MFVGAVEGQGKYVHSSINVAPIALNDWRCARFPACQKPQRECGGYRKNICIDFKDKINNQRFIGEHEERKQIYDLKRKRILEKERKKRNKKK
jgi:hypothetical protein